MMSRRIVHAIFGVDLTRLYFRQAADALTNSPILRLPEESMENVPGLLGKRGAPFATRFEAIVSEHGYAVENVRINAAEYGLPQIRKRIFYYGWQRSRVPRFRFPSPTRSEAQFRTVMDVVGDLPRPASTKEAAAVSDPLHWQMRLSALNLQRLRLIPPGGGFEDLPVSMRVNCHKNGAATVYSRRPVRVAENLTIVATYNPTDRSAIEIDGALLRRLRIIDFPPSTDQLSEMLGKNKVDGKVIDRLKTIFSDCKAKFPKHYEHLMPFGHGIFADIDEESPDLHRLWMERIRHMLRRPLMEPHMFTDVIEQAYPWRDKDFVLS